ncbi:MAG TPA: hypothetical protein VGC11_00105 [Acidimicrobiia bacterium]
MTRNDTARPRHPMLAWLALSLVIACGGDAATDTMGASPVDAITAAPTDPTTTSAAIPTSTAAVAVRRDLTSGLPRTASYAFLDVTLEAAALANVEPRTFLRDDQAASDETYLFLNMEILNTSDTDTANMPPTPFGLLIGGEPVPTAPVMVEGRPHIGLTSRRAGEFVIAFAVPPGTSFDDAEFTLAQEDRIPMVLPLTGDIPYPGYPVAAQVSGEGPAQGNGVGCRQSLYVTALGGRVAVDLLDSDEYPTAYGSRRAKVGEHFLSVDLRILNNGGSRCGAGDTNIGNSDLRLLVDGVPREPVTWVNTIIGKDAALDLTFDFAYPTDATTLELLVGSEEATPLLIPVDVSDAPSIPGEST